MYNPGSTYRVQFHKDFTFETFEKVIPYLQQLGIRTIYASPVFESVPGSMHGYDGVNPHTINPEIGTDEQLKIISGKLKQAGIGWIQDIVPNHMAFHPNNQWLMDVLLHGEASPYAGLFDIVRDEDKKIMAPFLGSSLKDVIKNRELKLSFKNNRLMLTYFETSYPVKTTVYTRGLSERDTEMLENINNDPSVIKLISDEQYYRLCSFLETDQRINYRRFFLINSLICLNMQDRQVFKIYHQYINSLIKEDVVQGLRIDHVDGLFDPEGYLRELRQMTEEDIYIIVEKILEPGEDLPAEWPVQGTTGYEFLSFVNNLFTNRSNEKILTDFYIDLTGDNLSLQQQIHDKKAGILYNHMNGELHNLCHYFISAGLAPPQEIPASILRRSIGEFLIECPVYRLFSNKMPLKENESNCVKNIFNRIKIKNPELIAGIQALEDVFLAKQKEENSEYHLKALWFFQRCMQFAAPLMAKGIEDTLMYTYNRFSGHNEVGDSPENFGISTDTFHQQMIKRQQQWPLSLNATSTHDTKRGEDVRARLNVLTEIAEEWIAQVKYWQKINASFQSAAVLDTNEVYFLYQALVGSFPFPGEENNDYERRMQEYLIKSLREAGQHTNWTSPDKTYETSAKEFVSFLLNQNGLFYSSFTDFLKQVTDFGIINSLSQVLLKCTCPGVPDIYQGTELWDLSLVDPDNRRSVNYNKRKQILKSFTKDTSLRELWKNRYNASIKLRLIQVLLEERAKHPTLFEEGDYIPLPVAGRYKDHIIAFIRHYDNKWLLTAAPLKLATISGSLMQNPLTFDWKDTHINLPPNAPPVWINILDMTKGKYHKNIPVKDIFKSLPLAVLKLSPTGLVILFFIRLF